MEDLKKEVEALLFASAKSLSIEELAALLNKTPVEIKSAAESLMKEYDERDSPMVIVSEGSAYRLTIRDKYAQTIQKIVFETELPKTVLETLAVIAYKHPALQSEITKIRTNKAYDHLRELEELGYIEREKQGRTKKIKLTPKFFQYFDIPREKLREAFAGFEAIERLIEEKQEEAKQLRHDIKRRQEEKKILDEQKRKELESKITDLDEKNKEMLGSLEVVEELPKEEDSEKLKVVDLPPQAPTAKTSEPPANIGKKIEDKKMIIEEQMEKEADKIANDLLKGMESKDFGSNEKELDEAAEELEKEKEELEKEKEEPVEAVEESENEPDEAAEELENEEEDTKDENAES